MLQVIVERRSISDFRLMAMNIASINDDVLRKILENFNQIEIFFVRLVCKRWSNLVQPIVGRNVLKAVAENFASIGSKSALEYLNTYYQTYVRLELQLIDLGMIF